TPRLLGRGREAHVRRRLDIGGAVLITAAIAAAVFAVSEGGAAGWSSPLVLSLYFQQVLHDSPLMTGLAIAPQGVVGFAAGAAGARLAARLGLHRLLVLTNAVALLGFLLLTRLPATGGYSPLLAAVTFVGFGTAGTAFGAMVTATRGVADGDQGFVGGVINTSRQIGA